MCTCVVHQVMKDNTLAKVGLKKVGVEPYNPNWPEENEHLFLPSEAYKTNGDAQAIAEICRDNEDIHTLTDARNILCATRALAKMQEDPAATAGACEALGVTTDELEGLLHNVELQKFANNSIAGTLVQPWWFKKLAKMNEVPAAAGEGNGRRVVEGTFYESRAQAMILNDPPRRARMELEQERKDEEAFQKELEKQEKIQEQEVIVDVMKVLDGYVHDDFDVEDGLKAEPVKQFIRRNRLSRRADYIAACAAVGRDVSKGLLHQQSLKYLHDLVLLNNSLADDNAEKIEWI